MVGCYHPHLLSPFISITEPVGSVCVCVCCEGVGHYDCVSELTLVRIYLRHLLLLLSPLVVCVCCEGVGHYVCVSELTLVTGDIKDENIVFISSKADTVLAVSGQSRRVIFARRHIHHKSEFPLTWTTWKTP